MKFNLGDKIYWVYSSTNYGKPMPCPMCFGKRFVTLILGDESQTKSACGFCERGMEGSTGTATVWEPYAAVRSGVISGISTKDGIRYEVGYETIKEYEAFSTEADAQIECDKQYSLAKERAKEWFEKAFIDCKKKQIWSAGYHKNCIKSAERNIEWHQLRLGMIKTGATNDDSK